LSEDCRYSVYYLQLWVILRIFMEHESHRVLQELPCSFTIWQACSLLVTSPGKAPNTLTNSGNVMYLPPLLRWTRRQKPPLMKTLRTLSNKWVTVAYRQSINHASRYKNSTQSKQRYSHVFQK